MNNNHFSREAREKTATNVTFNQVILAALFTAAFISLGAIITGYSGVIEVECSSDGCKAIIDGS